MLHSNSQNLIHSLAVLLLVALAGDAKAESWTSLNGGSTVEAKMIGMWADSIVLEMEDGRRITVSLSDLIAESRIQARDLAKVQAKNRSTVVDEYKAQAKEAAAPAPTPIPKPAPAPAYVQPKANAKVIEQLTLVDEQSRDGHMIASFDSLPPSYRKAISDLAKQGATKINADSWQQLVGSLHAIGDVIVTRQRWVFTHPRLETMTPATLEPIQDITLLVAGLFRDGLDPKAMDLQQLQTMPLRDWLMERDKAMSPYLAALNEYSHMSQSYELVSEKDGVANIKVSVGEFSMTIPYTQVEGFWVPKEMADNWEQWMKDAQQRLDETPDGTLLTDPMVALIPGMIQQVVGPLTAATDKKGFHAAMENVFAQAAPMASLAGVDLSRRKRGSSSGYSSEYGEDYPESGYPEGYGEEDMDTDTDMEEYESQMREQSYQGTGANPNIGARLEDTLRGR